MSEVSELIRVQHAREVELANALAVADWVRAMRHVDRAERLAGPVVFDASGNPSREFYSSELDYLAESRTLLSLRRSPAPKDDSQPVGNTDVKGKTRGNSSHA